MFKTRLAAVPSARPGKKMRTFAMSGNTYFLIKNNSVMEIYRTWKKNIKRTKGLDAILGTRLPVSEARGCRHQESGPMLSPGRVAVRDCKVSPTLKSHKHDGYMKRGVDANVRRT